ncbi:hypothetical protein MGYG_01288 [Nannizzia gypsea CBS 118893]|uniref:Uncharacterized protein n=1 Tax=Arthroderma gypseum (strain ATCC MYA-4604 / CBS 118893) TaxID=535722 RepID=E5R004_ARTGP|nr:hypothetical protein MGYG_01288 [Nannizzia gypsea CBS 118893]EFQ98253.1 hypothetical protein MGYG_01288 [Nannizzia gypsea CBS 118893]
MLDSRQETETTQRKRKRGREIERCGTGLDSTSRSCVSTTSEPTVGSSRDQFHASQVVTPSRFDRDPGRLLSRVLSVGRSVENTFTPVYLRSLDIFEFETS